MSEHGAQPEKLCTPTAHIFTEKDTRELFNKAYHATNSTTEPATEQEKTQITPTGTVSLSLQQLANVIYLCTLLKQRDENKDTATLNLVDKAFIFLALFIGYLVGSYL